MPYAAAYFGVPAHSLKALNDLTDVYGLRGKVDAVERYVKEVIVTEGLSDTPEAFAEVIDEISEALKLRKSESALSRLEKIYNYLRVQGKAGLPKRTLKRSSAADEIDHARNLVLSERSKTHPKTLKRLEGYMAFLK